MGNATLIVPGHLTKQVAAPLRHPHGDPSAERASATIPPNPQTSCYQAEFQR
jgi:hypothetical protein